MPLNTVRNASDVILRNQHRMQYANYIIQKQDLNTGVTNRIQIESGSGKSFSESLKIGITLGEQFTTPTEQSLILANNLRTVQVQSTGFLRSKNTLTANGFTIGDSPQKDMASESYTSEFTPTSYPDLFPNTATFNSDNIVQGDKSSEDRLIASYWSDLGDDIFDDWGYFYLYDTTTSKYYFPILSPVNEEDGVITTQTFSAFGRTFTIKHGWSVQGIFKLDISVADSLPFRFGAYGNMGSDESPSFENFTQNYTISNQNLTLYYRIDAEEGDANEKLYTYVIPKKVSENQSVPYDVYYNQDDMSFVTKELSSGVIIYFSKTEDVYQWVTNDIEFDT